MSRPKGSKNKKILLEEGNLTSQNDTVVKRGRGRPRKIKLNEALEIKQENNLIINPKEVKKEIRALRKLKLQCRAGTPERIDLEHKIKALKNKIIDVSTPEPEKEPLVAEILALQKQYNIIPTFEVLGIDLNKYSIEQLKSHIEYIKNKRRCSYFKRRLTKERRIK
jgi:uncharacterized protein with von Willebrand factor type A (vWA) domain